MVRTTPNLSFLCGHPKKQLPGPLRRLSVRSSVIFDLWYPVFNSPSDKYTNEISHHQEGHPRIRLHKEDQKQKISELTELVGSLNINESSENVPQFVVHK
eukprot:TRINITY_DN7019_c0_g1_i2.p1 TRINITY_DN7019_c0_g1~~TRINITY_DN7019_c0_g1_i2.p1  ORF type:complete len:100 (+),score=17.33 TRINITY_DN7019_c0_g1_i2:548-847(+)